MDDVAEGAPQAHLLLLLLPRMLWLYTALMHRRAGE